MTNTPEATGLVERLKYLAELLGPMGETEAASDVREAIAALSTPASEEVRDARSWLESLAKEFKLESLNKISNLLQRLDRELYHLRIYAINCKLGNVDASDSEIAAQLDLVTRQRDDFDKLVSRVLGDMWASEQISRTYLTRVSKEIDSIRAMEGSK